MLMLVGISGKAIFIPTLGFGAGLVVGEIGPGIAACTVIFADCPPGPLAQVGSPVTPRFAIDLQTFRFSGHGCLLIAWMDFILLAGPGADRLHHVRPNKLRQACAQSAA